VIDGHTLGSPLIRKRCFGYFILKLQEIFHFLQEKFKKINVVLLFNFTSSV
jgi:hypothetical protein